MPALSALEAPRVQRKCSACEREDDKQGVQAKLRVNDAGDEYEQEADRMADRVMRMPDPGAASAPGSASGAPSGRAEVGAAELGAGRGGMPLSAQDRSFFEPRFGVDFSHVRVHADAHAAAAAAALGARAFTYRDDVYFAAGEYAPGTSAGRRLTAHELTHVVQQGGGRASGIQRSLRVENPSGALPGAPPKENWQEVRDYIAALSSGFDVAAGGAITPSSAAVCTPGPLRTTERCLCDLHASADDWTILIDDLAWPHTEAGNHRVTVHSTRSPVAFGSWGGGAHAGTRIEQGNPRVLGHELCGHAWLMERGTHPSGPAPTVVGGRLMGRQSHDPTVTIENTVAFEMTPAAPTRGSFADPHHGESFARITVSGYASGATDPSTLSADMLARLTRIKDAMLADSDLRADIVGHTDRSGGGNAAVGAARARGVRAHLRALGVPNNRFLAVRGVGASECPPAPADNPACRKTDVFMFIFQGASLRNP